MTPEKVAEAFNRLPAKEVVAVCFEGSDLIITFYDMNDVLSEFIWNGEDWV